LFFGDDHGGEAVIGRRVANWARGNSAITNILLLSAVWAVGAVFANRNAQALGKILNQQGSVTQRLCVLYKHLVFTQNNYICTTVLWSQNLIVAISSLTA
jgi:hypothetical protein